MSRRRALALAILVPAVVAAALMIGFAILGDDGDGDPLRLASASDAIAFEWDIVIPDGTAARIAAGEEVAIVPPVMTAHVGEAIRIVNEDSEDHVVGVFFVGAGETLTQRFQSAGELQGECSVHSSGAFTLRVDE